MSCCRSSSHPGKLTVSMNDLSIQQLSEMIGSLRRKDQCFQTNKSANNKTSTDCFKTEKTERTQTTQPDSSGTLTVGSSLDESRTLSVQSG